MSLLFERLDQAAESVIGFLQTIGENVGRRSGAVLVSAGLTVQLGVSIVSAAAIGVVLGQLLPYAHRLKVHSKDRRDAGTGCAVVPEAMDLVEDCLDLFLIVLDRADHAYGASNPATLVISGV